MNVVRREPWTLERFLDWEERQEIRYEFDGARPVAMVGGTQRHVDIEANLIRAVGNRLEGSPCRVVGSNMKLRLARTIRYPDAMILCGPREPGRSDVDQATVIFEILSPSTSNTDIVRKNAEYRALATVQRYVILQQTHAAGVVFARKGEDWVAEIVSGEDAVLRLPEVGIEVPLRDIYRDVGLDPEPDEAA